MCCIGGDIVLLTLFRNILLMELTEGTLNLSQIQSVSKRSRISQANIPGSLCFSLLM